MFVHLSDIHLNEKSPYYELQKLALNSFIEQVIERRIKAVLITGDLSGHDAPHRVTYGEHLFLLEWIHNLSKHANILIIKGNHDSDYLLRSLSYASSSKDIEVILSPCKVGLVSSGVMYNIGCLPWVSVSDLKKFIEKDSNSWTNIVEGCSSYITTLANNYLEDKSINLITGHYTIKGTKLGNYEIPWHSEVMLDSSKFINNKKVLLGHIHNGSRPKDDIVYAGSPFQLTFGESPNKSVHMYESAGSEIIYNGSFKLTPEWRMFTFTINPGDDLKELKDRLLGEMSDKDFYTLFPRISIEAEKTKDLKYINELHSCVKDITSKINRDVSVKIKYKDCKEDPSEFIVDSNSITKLSDLVYTHLVAEGYGEQRSRRLARLLE